LASSKAEFFWIRIRKDPELFAGSGSVTWGYGFGSVTWGYGFWSVTWGYGFGSGSETGDTPYQDSS
jgi:hypothetical protein